MEKVRRVKRPSGIFIVRRRRVGVEPASGCLLFAPFWVVTRLRWQFDRQRQWSVELGAVPTRRLGGFVLPVERNLYDNRHDADEAMVSLVTQLERGDLDDRLPGHQ